MKKLWLDYRGVVLLIGSIVFMLYMMSLNV